jgi:hypothetical protein
MAGTHLVSGGPLALGAQIVSSLRLGPSTTKLTFEVSALETNRRLGWRTTAKGPLDWDAEYLCEPLGDGTTRVTSVGSIRLNGALRLLEPMMAGEVRSGEAKELVRLKELIESRS